MKSLFLHLIEALLDFLFACNRTRNDLKEANNQTNTYKK
jgi:hypothetical protein